MSPALGVLSAVVLLVAGVQSDWVWWPVFLGVPLALTVGAGITMRRPVLEMWAAILVTPLLTFIAGVIAFAIVYESDTFQ